MCQSTPNDMVMLTTNLIIVIASINKMQLTQATTSHYTYTKYPLLPGLD